MPDELIAFTEQEEKEYLALVQKLDEQFPPVSKRGFDLTKIRGTVEGKTAKAIVLQLSCSGWSIARIADTLGVPTQAVGRYLTEAIRDAAPIDDVAILRDFELVKMDAWEQWVHEQANRSCEDEVTVTETEGEKGSVVTTKRRGQAGNPAYIKLLLEIGKRRDKLLGTEKPTRVEINKQERKVEIHVVEIKTREDALAAQQQALPR